MVGNICSGEQESMWWLLLGFFFLFFFYENQRLMVFVFVPTCEVQVQATVLFQESCGSEVSDSAPLKQGQHMQRETGREGGRERGEIWCFLFSSSERMYFGISGENSCWLLSQSVMENGPIFKEKMGQERWQSFRVFRVVGRVKEEEFAEYRRERVRVFQSDPQNSSRFIHVITFYHKIS